MKAPTFSWTSFLTRPLEFLGRFQLALTGPGFFRPVAAWVYLAWFLLLTAVPGWLGVGSGFGMVWGAGVLVLGLALVWVYFRRDAEQRAAVRGILEGEGGYVIAEPFGKLDDPLLDIREKYPRRLRFGTLLAGGAGMTLGFARLCQGLHGAGLTGWFEVPEGTDPGGLGPWTAYGFLHVFRALDIFDTLTVYGIDRLSVSEVVERVAPPLYRWLQDGGWADQAWATAGYQPIHHRGAAASGMVWTFRAAFDLMLLQKLRALLEAYGLYRQVEARTKRPPAEERRDLMVRNLASTLRETGAFFTRAYVRLFLRRKRFGIATRAFAGQTVASAGVESREYAEEIVGLMEDAKQQGERLLVRGLLTALGRLEVRAEHLRFSGNGTASLALAEPQAGRIWAENGFGLEFCGIPAGKFTMGASMEDLKKEFHGADEMARREARHEVTLTRPFFLARAPVTQEFFHQVTGYNPSTFQEARLKEYRDADPAKAWQHPVENVSWFEAQAFCLWLTSLERRAGRLPAGWEYRLPTEAEWEHACRARTEVFLHDDIAERAWYDKNSGSHTHPVGEKQENEWQLRDMLGNVYEWTGDWFRGVMPTTPETDPSGPKSGAVRVIRGGSWFDEAVVCRAAYRRRDTPSYRYYNLGFRPALVPSGQPFASGGRGRGTGS